MSKSQSVALGNNVQARQDGNKLILEVDLNTELGLSKSGKSLNVGTTSGNKQFAGVTIGLNVYKSALVATSIDS